MSFEEFARKYYAEQLKLATSIVEKAFGEADDLTPNLLMFNTMMIQAVFDKIASPLVYLKEDYEKQGFKITVEQAQKATETVFARVVKGLGDLADNVEFTDQSDAVIIKAHQYLGKDTFKQISTVLKFLGGEWVSAKKGSHWRIPKKEA